MKEKDRQILEVDFGDIPEKLRGDYLDMYKGIQSEVISSTIFDENSDLSMTYLGRTDITRGSKIKAEEKFPISEQGYMVGKSLDGTECHILLNTAASNVCNAGCGMCHNCLGDKCLLHELCSYTTACLQVLLPTYKYRDSTVY